MSFIATENEVVCKVREKRKEGGQLRQGEREEEMGQCKTKRHKVSHIMLEEEQSVQGAGPWRRPSALEASRIRKKLEWDQI